MAFTPIFFTGFEGGIVYPPGNYAVLAGDPVKTGAYSALVGNMFDTQSVYPNLWYIPFSGQTDVYFGAWMCQFNYIAKAFTVGFLLSDGNLIKLIISNGYWDGYINSTLVVSGTLPIAVNTWRHLQFHVSVADNGGIFDSRIDGCANFTYSGDTKPGTGSTIVAVQIGTAQTGAWSAFYFDNVVIGTGDWPGDLRVDGMQPNADTATAEWTPSTGATNYACIDEREPSDTDYISTAVTGKRTIVELTDFDTTNRTPLAVNVYARMNKSNAAVDTIKYGVVSGATESVVDQSLTTVLTNYKTFLPLNPDGNVAWDDAALDALKLVFESVVT